MSPSFRRSSFCGDTSCVEVAELADGVRIVRNTTDPGVAVVFTADEWTAFLAGVKAGEFDTELPAGTSPLAESLHRCVESLDDLIRHHDDPGVEALGAVYEAKALLRRHGVKVGTSTTAASPLAHLDTLQAEVGEHCRRFLTANPEADRLADGLIVAEEFGEVIEVLLVRRLSTTVRAFLKRHHGGRPDEDWDALLRAEAGDALITLIHLAEAEGWSLAEVLTERWEEVRAR